LDQVRYLLPYIGQPVIHHAARLGELKIVGRVLVVCVRVVVVLFGGIAWCVTVVRVRVVFIFIFLGGIARPALGTVPTTVHAAVHVSFEFAGSVSVLW